VLAIGDDAGVSQMILVLWDDIALSERTRLRPAWIGGADWDPQGERIVVASGNAMRKLVLSIMDGNGRTVATLPATEGAAWPRWDSAGIVYDHWVQRPPIDPNAFLGEIRAIDPEWRAARNAVRLRSGCSPRSDPAALAVTRTKTARRFGVADAVPAARRCADP
jgi:hypothetical protein